MPQISRTSTSSSSSFALISRQNTVSSHDGRPSVRQSKRYSTALYLSMSAKEKDLEIEDDLARGEYTIVHTKMIGISDKLAAQKIQRDYKAKISSQSKKNFVLEKDVRYLDSRIALLIQNRMALEEVCNSGRPYLSPSFLADYLSSKMKWQIISRTLSISRRASSPMTKRLKNMATCSSCYSPSLVTLHTSAVLSP